MKKIWTHYDNLQVKENASIEVIRGTYKYLSQKWHPDKNPGQREEAERITKIINEAYAVLSDPQKRCEHDVWIKEQINRKQYKRSSSARSSDLNSETETRKKTKYDRSYGTDEKIKTKYKYHNFCEKNSTGDDWTGINIIVGVFMFIYMFVNLSLSYKEKEIDLLQETTKKAQQIDATEQYNLGVMYEEEK